MIEYKIKTVYNIHKIFFFSRVMYLHLFTQKETCFLFSLFIILRYSFIPAQIFILNNIIKKNTKKKTEYNSAMEFNALKFQGKSKQNYLSYKWSIYSITKTTKIQILLAIAFFLIKNAGY